MDFKKKIFLFIVLPWLLAIVTVVLVTIPSIGNSMSKLTELGEKQLELVDVESKLKKEQDIKELKNSTAELETTLQGFNLQFPTENNYEPFYIDIQNAMNEAGIILDKIAVSKEKTVKLPSGFFDEAIQDDPDVNTGSKKKKKKKKKGKDSKNTPISITYRTVKVDAVGKYSGIVDFLYYLSDYYRHLTIRNIAIKVNDNIKEHLNPGKGALQVIITFDIYKLKFNPIEDEESDKKKKKKKSKDESKGE